MPHDPLLSDRLAKLEARVNSLTHELKHSRTDLLQWIAYMEQGDVEGQTQAFRRIKDAIVRLDSLLARK